MPYLGQLVLYRCHLCDSVNLRAQTGSPDLPAVVTRVWDDMTVNLHVFDDGPGSIWKVSVFRGDKPGQWDYLPQGQPVAEAVAGG